LTGSFGGSFIENLAPASADETEAGDVADGAGALVGPDGFDARADFTCSWPSTTMCASAVSAPSSFTSTNANGPSDGCRWSSGFVTPATAVTVPVFFTSTQGPPSDASISE
jgi:hypothetical protein